VIPGDARDYRDEAFSVGGRVAADRTVRLRSRARKTSRLGSSGISACALRTGALRTGGLVSMNLGNGSVGAVGLGSGFVGGAYLRGVYLRGAYLGTCRRPVAGVAVPDGGLLCQVGAGAPVSRLALVGVLLRLCRGCFGLEVGTGN
jgi:hypothetical protein